MLYKILQNILVNLVILVKLPTNLELMEMVRVLKLVSGRLKIYYYTYLFIILLIACIPYYRRWMVPVLSITCYTFVVIQETTTNGQRKEIVAVAKKFSHIF